MDEGEEDTWILLTFADEDGRVTGDIRVEAGRYLVLRGRGFGLGAGIGVILTDLPSLTSLSISMTSGEAALFAGLDTRLALGVEAGDADADDTLLEMFAGLEDNLPALTGGFLVTEEDTFLTLAAEGAVCLAGVDDADPAISKLMSSRDTVSLFRMTLDLTLDLL